MNKGKFIVLEGLDGSGKSTQLKLICKKLEALGKKVYCTAEPTDSPTGKYLRNILSESLEKDMYLQSALFLADRLEHITDSDCGIKKYLDEDYIVISDRYYFSSFAYQGTATDIDWVMDINLNCERMLKPDLCIFFDVNPDTCKDRIDKTRSKPELYEKDIDKIREIATELGYAAKPKDYKKHPEDYKGHVGHVSTVIRIALMGRAQSPDVWAIQQIMGEEAVRSRLEAAINK